MVDCEDLVDSPERPEPGDSMFQITKNEEDTQSKTAEVQKKRENAGKEEASLHQWRWRSEPLGYHIRNRTCLREIHIDW